MKTSKWLIVSLIVLFLFGCTLPAGNKPVPSTPAKPKVVLPASPIPKPVKPASATTQPVTLESSAPKGGNVPVDLSIPFQNDPAPSGILDQLSWTAKGGGEMTQVCGDCDVTIKGDRITFSMFEPSQELRALVYRSTGANESKCADGSAEYVTTLLIQVDEAGNFSSKLNGPTKDLLVVYVLAVRTGDKIWRNFSVPYEHLSCSDFASSCPGAPPQKLKVDQTAYVCTSRDSVKLREGPGKSYPVVKSLVPGADVQIIGGPKCANNWSWWQVKTESGYTGWMAEGGDNADPYFICPRP